jgi:hypothetical protein
MEDEEALRKYEFPGDFFIFMAERLKRRTLLYELAIYLAEKLKNAGRFAMCGLAILHGKQKGE